MILFTKLKVLLEKTKRKTPITIAVKININPNNVMQIDWKREFLCSPVKRSWKESFDLLMGGAEKCNRVYIKNLPSHWLQ